MPPVYAHGPAIVHTLRWRSRKRERSSQTDSKRLASFRNFDEDDFRSHNWSVRHIPNDLWSKARAISFAQRTRLQTETRKFRSIEIILSKLEGSSTVAGLRRWTTSLYLPSLSLTGMRGWTFSHSEISISNPVKTFYLIDTSFYPLITLMPFIDPLERTTAPINISPNLQITHRLVAM